MTDVVKRDIPAARWDNDFFTGAQVNVYFGDVWVDDIVSLSFSLEQTKRPIYGYASQYYDAVAKGKISVRGNFTINFKENGYLYVILDYLKNNFYTKEEKGGSSETLQKAFFMEKAESGRGDAKVISRNIENILEKKSSGAEGFDRLTYFLNADMSKFEDLAEAYEDSVWSDEGVSVKTIGGINKKYKRPDEFGPFDIIITYGDINASKEDHTVKRITGVELLGASQIVNSDSEPIYEAYQFIARNIL